MPEQRQTASNGVTDKDRITRRVNTESRSFYTAFNHVLVRAPLLPIGKFLELGSHTLTDDQSILRALVVGSTSLFDALERAGADPDEKATAHGKLLRYVTRMSSRPTPYGLFAGVQLAKWGAHTQIGLAPEGPRTRTRPDMEWLCGLVLKLESRPEIRRQLRFIAARNVLVDAGRAILHSQAPTAVITVPDTRVSIRASRTVMKALESAQTWVSYSELLDGLLAMPGATQVKVERMISELWEQTFLLTELRPPMTLPNPARYVADRLAAISGAEQEHRLLEELLDAMSAWDHTPLEQAPAAYKRLLDLMRVRKPSISVESKHFVEVDMAHRLRANQISAAVAADAAIAAELLLRLTPSPKGLAHIAAYRHAFEQRYGADCEVPLLELLDPDTGLGSPYQQPVGYHSVQPHSDAQRQCALREVAIDAVRHRRRCIQLDDTLLKTLETWSPDPATAPTSLDIPVFVIAATPGAIDAGNFRIVVGPNAGAVFAGQSLGRFAELLGSDATTALQNIVAAEQAHEPQTLSAELSYLPHSLRSANVTIRPLVCDYEIVCGTTPAVMDRAIPLDELRVGVRHGRFRIRWSKHDADVLVHTRHMLNSSRAPTVCRFLSDVRQDGLPQLSPFHWGGASDFPYLPRVERGRVVLSVARWRLDPRLANNTPSQFRGALDDWRFDWQVPRYVYLSAGDNRLLLDLDDSAHIAQLRDEGRRAPQNSYLLLEEAMPGPHDAWLAGPGGHYITELVVSLALSRTQRRKPFRGQQDSSLRWKLRPVVSRRDQLRPAGSNWLFVKLYAPQAGQDEFLTGPMTAFCAAMRSGGLVHDWFFIRYNDPAAHIRLRLRGEPDALIAAVLPQFCLWSARLIDEGAISRMCVDTYEREVSRYGGPAAIDAAEDLFAADSRAAIDLLELCRQDGAVDRTCVSMLNIDSLLTAFGFDARRRIAWCQAHVISKVESGAEYRARNRDLCVYLADPPNSHVEVFATRASSLEPVRARLAALAGAGLLEQPLDDLLSSFVHMSCNRLPGPQWPSEQRIIGLLLRTRTALLHMPAGSC